MKTKPMNQLRMKSICAAVAAAGIAAFAGDGGSVAPNGPGGGPDTAAAHEVLNQADAGEPSGAQANPSPFATPLSAAETAEATGRDTEAPVSALLPPEYGLRLGMGTLRACIARPGLLHKDGESNADAPDGVVVRSSLLPERKGRGDVLAVFDKGRLALVALNWGFDDGWTADEPGKIRQLLDDAMLRLGPPTKRMTWDVGERLPDGSLAAPPPVRETRHFWAWTRGDFGAVLEIRRATDSRHTLRASYVAGPLSRMKFPENGGLSGRNSGETK